MSLPAAGPVGSVNFLINAASSSRTIALSFDRDVYLMVDATISACTVLISK